MTKHYKKLKGGITVASQNIRGERGQVSRLKWTQLNQLMRDRNLGILAIQET